MFLPSPCIFRFLWRQIHVAASAKQKKQNRSLHHADIFWKQQHVLTGMACQETADVTQSSDTQSPQLPVFLPRTDIAWLPWKQIAVTWIWNGNYPTSLHLGARECVAEFRRHDWFQQIVQAYFTVTLSPKWAWHKSALSCCAESFFCHILLKSRFVTQ